MKPSWIIPFIAVAWIARARTEPQTPGEPVQVNSTGMHMLLMLPGSFLMGSPPDAAMRQDEEYPHRVTLTRPFRIAATEVTQKQWLTLMPFNRSPQQGDDLPVTGVSWADAQEFCLKLSEKEAAPYRLPTEAEWEYACRAGGGDSEGRRVGLDMSAWYAGNSEEASHPVGLKQPNGQGIFDMLGNVAEWTLDAYGPYSRVDAVTDPSVAASGSGRVVRGGSWRSFPPALRCAARTGLPESYQVPYVGLRVVQEVQ